MIYQVFAVFDEKAAAYARPFLFSTKGEAIRAFRTSIMDPKHPFSLHAADYTLFQIAAWDDANAQYTQLQQPESLGKALEHKAMMAKENDRA